MTANQLVFLIFAGGFGLPILLLLYESIRNRLSIRRAIRRSDMSKVIHNW